MSIGAKWSLDRVEMKRMVGDGKTAAQIAEATGCPLRCLYWYLKQFGLKPVRPRPARHQLTEEQEKLAVEIYQSGGMSAACIAENMGVDKGVIHGALARFGIKKRTTADYRRYQLNEGYFDEIDSEQKAYFLGLLYADGCCMHRKIHGSSSWVTHLGLEKKDAYMVEAFRDAICPNRDCLVGNARNQRRVGIYSRRIFESLSKLGCVPRKSLILKFPTSKQVPNHLLRHFVRGYFDGDGSVCCTNLKRGHVSIAGSVSFCAQLAEKLEEQLGRFNVTVPKQTPNIRIVQTGKQSILRAFYDYTYRDATIFLKRKKDKYDELKTHLDARFEYWAKRGRAI